MIKELVEILSNVTGSEEQAVEIVQLLKDWMMELIYDEVHHLENAIQELKYDTRRND